MEFPGSKLAQAMPEGDRSIVLDGPENDAAYQVVRESMLKLWDVVDSLYKLRPRRSDHYHVTIFGSARILPETPLYDDVRKLARELATMGCDIVTGGGPGLMQAANAGAIESGPRGREQSIGIRVDLGFEQGVNAFVGRIYEHRTFFSRLHHFVMLSNAFVVVPGGIGTTLETMMIWQLLQVRKLYDTPLVLVGPMWTELVKRATASMIENAGTPLADPVDMMIPRCVPNVNEAVALIRDHHATWMAEIEAGRAELCPTQSGESA
jgi:uncharacterized protein (TIGR00730 family)